LQRFTILLLSFAVISYFAFDREIAVYFHNHPLYPSFFKTITKLGNSKYSIIPSLIIFLISSIAIKKFDFKRVKKLQIASLYILLSVVISGLIADVIKLIFARYRPPAYILHQNYGFNWFEWGYMVNSFPSGHSATAFSLFLALGLIFKRALIPFLILAFLVAFSRTAIGVHYLSDVIVGSLIGALTALYLYEKIYKERV